jgi:hypothetical protein
MLQFQHSCRPSTRQRRNCCRGRQTTLKEALPQIKQVLLVETVPCYVSEREGCSLNYHHIFFGLGR